MAGTQHHQIPCTRLSHAITKIQLIPSTVMHYLQAPLPADSKTIKLLRYTSQLYTCQNELRKIVFLTTSSEQMVSFSAAKQKQASTL